jgi:hypothetical protein
MLRDTSSLQDGSLGVVNFSLPLPLKVVNF